MPQQKRQRVRTRTEKPAARHKDPRPREGRPAARKTDRATQGQTLKATLPGDMYRRGDRWWWRVKLPGEDRTKARPLKARGDKAAADDRKTAEQIALEMWEQAIREDAGRQLALENSDKVERLKAQFLDKVRHFTELVETANAKAEAEARARAEIEARLAQRPREPVITTGQCECCGAAGIPVAGLTRIDSGQTLCSACLAALRADAARDEVERPEPPVSLPPTDSFTTPDFCVPGLSS